MVIFTLCLCFPVAIIFFIFFNKNHSNPIKKVVTLFYFNRNFSLNLSTSTFNHILIHLIIHKYQIFVVFVWKNTIMIQKLLFCRAILNTFFINSVFFNGYKLIKLVLYVDKIFNRIS